MKAFLGGVAVMIVIAIGAAVVMDTTNESVRAKYTSDSGSVRLDN